MALQKTPVGVGGDEVHTVSNNRKMQINRNLWREMTSTTNERAEARWLNAVTRQRQMMSKDAFSACQIGGSCRRQVDAPKVCTSRAVMGLALDLGNGLAN